MSTDTPRAERVTLTNEERVALFCDMNCAASPETPGHFDMCVVHDTGQATAGVSMDSLAARVERILAAREQALREEIAGQIEAKAAHAWPSGVVDEYDRGVHQGLVDAARIARGETR